MAKKINKDLVEVEGIQCEVKNPARQSVVLYYQETLREAISAYERGVSRWSERKRGYFNSLKTNVIIAPFVLGWLHKPEEDEYLVIKGYLTIEELQAKRDKATGKKKPVAKKRARKRAIKEPKATVTKVSPVKKKVVTTSKPVTKGKSLNNPKGATMGPVKKALVKKTPVRAKDKAITTKKVPVKKAPVKRASTKKAAPKSAASNKKK